jgi:PHD/YefM family antitoxin component YafN of YafNO toxin-antitoxin module
MQPMPTIKPQYITDADGRKKGVILSIEEYEELMEDIEDLAVLAERREEPTISHEELVADLKRNGYLPN